jgi:hypothetical protein
MLRFARFLVPVLVCATLAAGCSGGDGSTEPGSVTGTYTLTQINGASPPFTFLSGRQMISGTLTLNSNGTHRQTFGLGFQGNTTQTYSFTGGYTVSGSTISMSLDQLDEDGFALRSGEISGRTITGQAGRGTTRAYTFKR